VDAPSCLAFLKVSRRIVGAIAGDDFGQSGDRNTMEFSRRLNRREAAMLMLAAAIGSAVPAGASTTAAEAYVNAIAGEVMSLANAGQKGPALRAKFATLMSRYINLRAIANYALGTYVKKLPAARKDEFYGLVNNYAAALFVYYVEDFRGTELEIKSTTQQGKFTVIQSAIKLKGGGREQVRWRLVPAGGAFRVNDVNLKGVWLTISMKDRFTKVLTKSKGNFEPLFAELREAETW
jgi:phospholipid transport system substrate-binding protein